MQWQEVVDEKQLEQKTEQQEGEKEKKWKHNMNTKYKHALYLSLLVHNQSVWQMTMMKVKTLGNLA